MVQKKVIKRLYALAKKNKTLARKDKVAIEEAIAILSKPKTKARWNKAIKILVKLLGIGSKFF